MRGFCNGIGTAILIAALLLIGHAYVVNSIDIAIGHWLDGLGVAKAETSPIFGTPLTHAASLPKELVGEWCRVKTDSDEYERRQCSEEVTSHNATMTISKHSVVYFEDGCDFTKVQQLDRNVYYVHGDCGGEGMSWNDSMIFQLLTNGHIRLIVITHSDEKQTG